MSSALAIILLLAPTRPRRLTKICVCCEPEQCLDLACRAGHLVHVEVLDRRIRIQMPEKQVSQFVRQCNELNGRLVVAVDVHSVMRKFLVIWRTFDHADRSKVLTSQKVIGLEKNTDTTTVS